MKKPEKMVEMKFRLKPNQRFILSRHLRESNLNLSEFVRDAVMEKVDRARGKTEGSKLDQFTGESLLQCYNRLTYGLCLTDAHRERKITEYEMEIIIDDLLKIQQDLSEYRNMIVRQTH